MAQIFQTAAKNYPEYYYREKENLLRIVILHLFWGDLSKTEKLSEI